MLIIYNWNLSKSYAFWALVSADSWICVWTVEPPIADADAWPKHQGMVWLTVRPTSYYHALVHIPSLFWRWRVESGALSTHFVLGLGPTIIGSSRARQLEPFSPCCIIVAGPLRYQRLSRLSTRQPSVENLFRILLWTVDCTRKCISSKIITIGPFTMTFNNNNPFNV